MNISETRKRIQRHYEGSRAIYDDAFDIIGKGSNRATFDVHAEKFCKILDLVYESESYSFYKQVKPSLMKYGLRMYCMMENRKSLDDARLVRA